eukprot:1147097-Pelagomonas_calceolata.AAC.1
MKKKKAEKKDRCGKNHINSSACSMPPLVRLHVAVCGSILIYLTEQSDSSSSQQVQSRQTSATPVQDVIVSRPIQHMHTCLDLVWGSTLRGNELQIGAMEWRNKCEQS